MQSGKIPIISIVICTYRRFDLLRNAVASLAQQTADRMDFEIIVVDNDLRPNIIIKQIVQYVSEKVDIGYIHEPELGLSCARNAGGKAARGIYVGYIDDDAKVPSDYIETGLKIIEEIKPDIFGGPYYPYYLTIKPVWFKDDYETGHSSDKTGFLEIDQFLNGTNMIYHKQILISLSWFNTSLGMEGNKIAFGEETDLQIKARLRLPNIKVYYNTDLFVYHLVTSIKLKIRQRFIRMLMLGYSQAYLSFNNMRINKKHPVLIIIKTLIFFFIKGIGRMIFRDKTKYPYWQNFAYEKLAKYFASIGQECRYIRDWF